jgi:hypothetical protein
MCFFMCVCAATGYLNKIKNFTGLVIRSLGIKIGIYVLANQLAQLLH